MAPRLHYASPSSLPRTTPETISTNTAKNKMFETLRFSSSHKRSVTSLSNYHPIFTPSSLQSHLFMNTATPNEPNKHSHCSSSNNNDTNSQTHSHPTFSTPLQQPNDSPSTINNNSNKMSNNPRKMYPPNRLYSPSSPPRPYHIENNTREDIILGYHNHEYDSMKETLLEKFRRLLKIIDELKKQKTKPVFVKNIKGVLKISSHLIDSVNNNDGTIGDDFPILYNNQYLIHGISRLLVARKRKEPILYIHSICPYCVNKHDLNDHYSLILLICQLKSNATIPLSFLNYVHYREGDAFIHEGIYNWFVQSGFIKYSIVHKFYPLCNSSNKRKTGEQKSDVYQKDVITVGKIKFHDDSDRDDYNYSTNGCSHLLERERTSHPIKSKKNFMPSSPISTSVSFAADDDDEEENDHQQQLQQLQRSENKTGTEENEQSQVQAEGTQDYQLPLSAAKKQHRNLKQR